jgi:nucleoid DNA-binding protein
MAQTQARGTKPPARNVAAKPAAKPTAAAAKPAARTVPVKAAPAKAAAAPAKPAKIGLKELVGLVATDMPFVSQATAQKVVEKFIDKLKTEFSHGVVINIKDFGIFSLQDKPARTGRNPATGDTIQIPAKTVAKFRFAKNLRDLAA